MVKYNIVKDLARSIFRAYDIRGVVGKTLTPDVVYTIGLAIGSEAQARGVAKIAVGRDGRLSGPELLAALIAGLLATGCDVVNLGAITTPILYYATKVLELNSGVMLTGSHNPANYNGIKIVLGDITLSEQAIQDLYLRIQQGKFTSGAGAKQQLDLLERYVRQIIDHIKLARPLKVVIDCGNGIGAKVAPLVFKGVGCEVMELFCQVDGTFPNHHPDPSVVANLQDLIRAVNEQQADIGLAFDGDGDRLGVVTNKGEIIWPDRQLMVFIRDILPRYPGAIVPFDVKCTRHLAEEITKCGGMPDMYRTGHALIKARMKELGSPIGGELSGHLFIKDRWFGFDDGVYAGARLLEILAKDKRTSSEIFATVPNSINTPELKLPLADEIKYKFMQQFLKQAQFTDGKVTTIDGIRVDFTDGFGLMRPSNTTPMIIFRFEGETKQALERIQQIFKRQLLTFDNKLELPF